MTGSWEKRHVQAEAQKKANAGGVDVALFSRYTVEHGRREWAFCANVDLVGREWRFETFVEPNQCPDCGEQGERRGHMSCQYPAD